jgi:hypothetical protein
MSATKTKAEAEREAEVLETTIANRKTVDDRRQAETAALEKQLAALRKEHNLTKGAK